MRTKKNRQECLDVPPQIAFIEGELYDVLDKHYYVRKTSFNDISNFELSKHEMYHLSKALHKLYKYILDNNEENFHVVSSQVVPDLLVYAIECAWGFDIKWWDRYLLDTSVQTVLCDLVKRNFRNENLIVASKELDHGKLLILYGQFLQAVSRLGELCDRHDHSQNSTVDVENEVVIPILDTSFTLSHYFKLDLDKLFQNRLIDIANKYVGQPKI